MAAMRVRSKLPGALAAVSLLGAFGTTLALDGIDLTLKHRAHIDAFVARDRLERPWIYSTVIPTNVEKLSA